MKTKLVDSIKALVLLLGVAAVAALIVWGVMAVNGGALASEFTKWREVCYNADGDKELRHSAAEGMSKTAESFREWKWVCICAESGSQLQKNALDKTAELADNCEDKAEVAKHARDYGDTELQNRMIQEMNEEAETFDDWFHARLYASDNQTALYYMIRLAESGHEWGLVLRNSDNSVLRQFALGRMVQADATFNKWWWVASDFRFKRDAESQAIFNQVMEQMFQTAETTDDWMWIYRWSLPDSFYREIALKKMVE